MKRIARTIGLRNRSPMVEAVIDRAEPTSPVVGEMPVRRC